MFPRKCRRGSKIRHLNRIGEREWIGFEYGFRIQDGGAPDLMEQCKAKIAVLERLEGRQALEIGSLTGTQRNALRSRSRRVSFMPG